MDGQVIRGRAADVLLAAFVVSIAEPLPLSFAELSLRPSARRLHECRSIRGVQNPVEVVPLVPDALDSLLIVERMAQAALILGARYFACSGITDAEIRISRGREERRKQQ
jgi:hypothetical protein